MTNVQLYGEEKNTALAFGLKYNSQLQTIVVQKYSNICKELLAFPLKSDFLMVLIRLLAFLKQDVPFKKHALWTYPEQLHNGCDRELLFEMKLSDMLGGVY